MDEVGTLLSQREIGCMKLLIMAVIFTAIGILIGGIFSASGIFPLQILPSSSSDNCQSSPVLQAQITESERLFLGYIPALQDKVRAHWTSPKWDANYSITAWFTVNRRGELKSVSIQKSSGSQVLDDAAIAAIHAAAPFAPLPEAFTSDEVDVEFIFDFDVEKERSKHSAPKQRPVSQPE